MAEQHVYDCLPYPFPHVPPPGAPVSPAVISEAILPLMQNVYCTLYAFASAAEREDLQIDHLGVSMSMLAEQLELAIGLLQRLDEEKEA